MIALPKKFTWARRVRQGLYRERKFLLTTSIIIPVLVFVALSLVLLHHPGPHGIGSIQSLIAAFAGIYSTLLACFVVVVAIAVILSSERWDSNFVRSPLAGDPSFWIKREDRPPRA
jgi:hypothetical protein